MRSPFLGGRSQRPDDINIVGRYGDYSWPYYFPVEQARFTGWGFYATDKNNLVRIEDFSGATPLRPGWPTLTVDKNQLKTRYSWADSTFPLLPWREDIAALPEVGWIVTASREGAEGLYLYNSKYGRSHPMGNDFSYEGGPVAVRYTTSRFQTGFFAFTPLSIQDDSMQVVIDSMMNFLYKKWTK